MVNNDGTLCVYILGRERDLTIYPMINSVYLINLLFIATMIFYGPSTFILFDEWGLNFGERSTKV